MMIFFVCFIFFFFFNDTATTEIYTSLHDALPICVIPASASAVSMFLLRSAHSDRLKCTLRKRSGATSSPLGGGQCRIWVLSVGLDISATCPVRRRDASAPSA